MRTALPVRGSRWQVAYVSSLRSGLETEQQVTVVFVLFLANSISRGKPSVMELVSVSNLSRMANDSGLFSKDFSGYQHFRQII
jgi:hypothetical protein